MGWPRTEVRGKRPKTVTSPEGTTLSLLNGTPLFPAAPSRFAWGCVMCAGCGRRRRQALVRERMLGPFASIHDLTRRVPELRKDELTTLAEIGALNSVSKPGHGSSRISTDSIQHLNQQSKICNQQFFCASGLSWGKKLSPPRRALAGGAGCARVGASAGSAAGTGRAFAASADES